MNISRLGILIILLICSSIAFSCSSSSNTVSEEKTVKKEPESLYPGWYNTGRSIYSDESSYAGYATAIASDSAEASEKATAQAKARLKTSISSRLESIRNDAVIELGSESGLDNPQFIVTIRKAENEVTGIAEVAQTKTEKNEKGTGFRGFTKVSVSKSVLIEELDKAFSAQGKAWNALKESQAFGKF